jgi:hypothetical protein
MIVEVAIAGVAIVNMYQTAAGLNNLTSMPYIYR